MAVFCSSLISCFPGMLFRYFLNDLEIVPVAPITLLVSLFFTFHITLYFCCKVFFILVVIITTTTSTTTATAAAVVCVNFNDCVSNSEYRAPNFLAIVNNLFFTVRKEMVVAGRKALFHYLCEGG